MTRTIVFLEANATGTTYEAMQLTRTRGYTNVFLTGDRSFYSALADNPLALADVMIDCDTYNPAEILRALRSVPADGIIAFDDYHLPIAAMCAMALGLPHADVRALVSARYKDLARECTRGLPGAVRSRVVSEQELHEINLDALMYPLVIKPIDESGSVSVRLCRRHADVEAAIDDFKQHEVNLRGYRPVRFLLIEEYIEGEEYSCELFWDTKSKAWQIAGVTKKLLGPPPYFVEIGHIFPAVLPASIRDKIEQRVLSWIGAIGLCCGAAHVEFRLNAEDAYLIEVNPRLPGGHITELVRMSEGVDLVAQYLDFHLPGASTATRQPPSFAVSAIRFFLSSEVVDAQGARQLEAELAGLPTFRRSKIALPSGGAVEARSNYDRRGYGLLAGTPESIAQDLAWINARLNS